jgi:hypothetical protein
MSNFKSGSGNLNFGGGDDDEEDEKSESAGESPAAEEKARSEETESTETDRHSSHPSNLESRDSSSSSSPDSSGRSTPAQSTSTTPEAEQYPYFVRRNNVGDERDTRLEIHVRDMIAEQEAKYRNELAEQLGASDISKTDAREFALLAAFEHPELVAELMKNEGFGTI